MKASTRMSSTHRSYWAPPVASMPGDRYEWPSEPTTTQGVYSNSDPSEMSPGYPMGQTT